MRVISFNIRGAYWEADLENYWPKRAGLNVATIKRYMPDVIGFQELQDGNFTVYQRELPEYRWSLGPHYGNEDPFEYPALAWNPQRLRLVGAGGFWLSETPLVHSGSWETDCIRSAQWLRFQPITGGPTFIILNTHLDHVSEQARVAGAQLIVSVLASEAGLVLPSEPVIVIGDFNCDPGSAAYQIFLQAGFADSFVVAGGDQGPESFTYHGFQGQSYQLKDGRSERIDWVLVRGTPVINAQIIRDEAPPIYPSDHYPVLADIQD